MADLQDASKALRFISDNFDNDQEPDKRNKSIEYARKVGLTAKDLMEYRNASVSPDDPTSIKQKNAVFSKIANKFPAKEQRGVLWNERLQIKNFIDENPALQKKYLDEKGYDTRIVNNRVEVRKPDEPYFKVVDPEGLDWSDIALEIGDIAFDLAKAGAETLGMAGKAAGAAAAPATGGASLIAAGALGGGLALGSEYVRQAAGKALGLRDKPDFPLMAKEAAWGAGISSTLKGVGDLAIKYGAAEKAAALSKQGWRKGAETLEKSWETLGVKMTPALKFANEQIRKLEDAIVKQPSRFFTKTKELDKQYREMARAWGEGLMSSIESASQDLFQLPIRQVEEAPEAIGRAADKVAVSVLNTITGAKEAAEGKLMPFVGADIRKTIMEKLEPKLAKAKQLYNEVDAALASNELIPKKQSIYKKINEMRPQEIKTGVTSDLNNWLDAANESVDQITTIKGLDELSTSLLNAIEGGSKDIRSAAKNIRGSVLDARAKTYSDTILSLVKKSKDSSDPMAKNAAAYWENVFMKRKQADRLYAELNSDITSIIKRPKVPSSMAFSAEEKLDKLAKTSPEEIFEKVAATGDVEKMKWVADKFPNEYKQVVGQQLGKVWLEVAQTNKDIRKVVLKEFNKLTDSQKLAMMGDKANETIVNLADIVNNADNKIAVAEWLDSIQKKVKLDDEFTQNVVDKLKSKTKSELATIFGADALEKVKAITNIGSFRRTIVGPSGTPDALRYFKPSWFNKKFSEIKNEYDLLKEYKREVLSPETAGASKTKFGKKLQKPSTFGKIEAGRAILTTPKSEENQ